MNLRAGRLCGAVERRGAGAVPRLDAAFDRHRKHAAELGENRLRRHQPRRRDQGQRSRHRTSRRRRHRRRPVSRICSATRIGKPYEMKRAVHRRTRQAGVRADCPKSKLGRINTAPVTRSKSRCRSSPPSARKTGLPDHGTLTLRYVPDQACLELKSLKMYTLAYRNLGIFQENVVNRMLADIVKAATPDLSRNGRRIHAARRHLHKNHCKLDTPKTWPHDVSDDELTAAIQRGARSRARAPSARIAWDSKASPRQTDAARARARCGRSQGRRDRHRESAPAGVQELHRPVVQTKRRARAGLARPRTGGIQSRVHGVRAGDRSKRWRKPTGPWPRSPSIIARRDRDPSRGDGRASVARLQESKIFARTGPNGAPDSRSDAHCQRNPCPAHHLRAAARLPASASRCWNKTSRAIARISSTRFPTARSIAILSTIQKRLWADLEKIRAEYEKLIHTELKLIRQKATRREPVRPRARVLVPSPHPNIDWLRFAETFRGPEEQIHEHQQRYVQRFAGHRRAILDLGCGRGEFLEAAREAGLAARHRSERGMRRASAASKA